MKIVLVNGKKTISDFHDTARLIYKNDINWICPLELEIESIFDKDKNKSFNNGKAQRWVLYDNKLPIGRIAAFFDTRKTMLSDQPTGGIGFYECVNDLSASTLLFNTAVNWLKDHDIEAMDGPVNFGENFNHWGLLVDGFQQQGYGMPYHKPYYRDLFEEYGFEVFFKQISYHLNPSDFSDRFLKIAERVISNPDIQCKQFTFSEQKKFIGDLLEIYNDTWSTFKEDATLLEFSDIEAMLVEARDIIDERLIWFAYKGGEPAAFFVMFPDINQILKHLNGKLHLWNKLKFAWLKKRKVINRTRAFVMGVKPAFQRMGIESAIFYNMKPYFNEDSQYKEVELSWVGDYNPWMMRLYETSGARYAKTHITYRYLFDRKAEFKRFPIPDIKLKGRLKDTLKK